MHVYIYEYLRNVGAYVLFVHKLSELIPASYLI